jgi:hypothetical protein
MGAQPSELGGANRPLLGSPLGPASGRVGSRTDLAVMRKLMKFFIITPDSGELLWGGGGYSVIWRRGLEANIVSDPGRCLVPKFVIQHPISSAEDFDFEDFVKVTRGLFIRSAAASASDSRGPDFLELGLSQTFNLHVEARGDTLVVSLVPTLDRDEFPPVQLEIISHDEVVTAELLQRRLHHLRQVYATALLLGDDRQNALAALLRHDPRADLEQELVAEDDKLVILDASSGSFFLSLIAHTKKAYLAILYACSVPYAEGRKAILGRVTAGTALAELEVQAKAQDLRLKEIHGFLDVAKKIDSIKDKDMRELIRNRLLTDMAELTITWAAPLQTPSVSFEPPETPPKIEQIEISPEKGEAPGEPNP